MIKYDERNYHKVPQFPGGGAEAPPTNGTHRLGTAGIRVSPQVAGLINPFLMCSDLSEVRGRGEVFPLGGMIAGNFKVPGVGNIVDIAVVDKGRKFFRQLPDLDRVTEPVADELVAVAGQQQQGLVILSINTQLNGIDQTFHRDGTAGLAHFGLAAQSSHNRTLILQQKTIDSPTVQYDLVRDDNLGKHFKLRVDIGDFAGLGHQIVVCDEVLLDDRFCAFCSNSIAAQEGVVIEQK